MGYVLSVEIRNEQGEVTVNYVDVTDHRFENWIEPGPHLVTDIAKATVFTARSVNDAILCPGRVRDFLYTKLRPDDFINIVTVEDNDNAPR